MAQRAKAQSALQHFGTSHISGAGTTNDKRETMAAVVTPATNAAQLKRLPSLSDDTAESRRVFVVIARVCKKESGHVASAKRGAQGVRVMNL